MNNAISIVGLVWYAEEDFAQIKALMLDSDKLPPRYADWQARAENGERQLRAQGHKTVRAYLKPEAFQQWCRTNGHEVNSQGRMAFANWYAKEVHTKGAI